MVDRRFASSLALFGLLLGVAACSDSERAATVKPGGKNGLKEVVIDPSLRITLVSTQPFQIAASGGGRHVSIVAPEPGSPMATQLARIRSMPGSRMVGQMRLARQHADGFTAVSDEHDWIVIGDGPWTPEQVNDLLSQMVLDRPTAPDDSK